MLSSSLLSTTAQSCTRNYFSTLSLTTKPPPTQKNHHHRIISLSPRQYHDTSSNTHKKLLNLKVSAASSSSISESPPPIYETEQKLKVLVKPIIEKPRLVLKFIWMEKNIGIAIDQYIPGGNGTIPLSPYYFWPRKDAWEELKVMLEGKPWISNKQMVILLNQATDIINLWQQSSGEFA